MVFARVGPTSVQSFPLKTSRLFSARSGSNSPTRDARQSVGAPAPAAPADAAPAPPAPPAPPPAPPAPPAGSPEAPAPPPKSKIGNLVLTLFLCRVAYRDFLSWLLLRPSFVPDDEALRFEHEHPHPLAHVSDVLRRI